MFNREFGLPSRAPHHGPAPARPGVDRARALGRLPGLDALRAIAALCVVAMHVGAIWPGAPRVIGTAYLAVDFFFLLSGFVMARTYEARMKGGAMGAWRFMAARVRRLWPTMAVGAALAIPFLWRDTRDPAVFLAAAVPNLLLLPSFATPVLFALNTPAWSIFFEMVANLAHVVALRRLPSAVLAVVTAGFLAWAAACAVRFGNLDLGSAAQNMAGGFARVGFAYSLGVLLWRWHGDRPPLAVPPLFAMVAMPVLFVGSTMGGLEGPAFDLAFIAVACPLLLWGGLDLPDRPGPLQTAMVAAGAISFPLYAIHYPVLLGAEAAGLRPWAAPGVAVGVAAMATRAMGGFNHMLAQRKTF